jgi:two-component system, OmpR family, response regulator
MLRSATDRQEAPVLVADADETSREELSRQLEEAGYVVDQVASGADALEVLAQTAPCLALLEVKLSDDVCGYEVCRAIREEFGEALPVVFVSGSRTESFDRVAGLLVGADDYVIKPYARDELLTRIRSLLRRSRPLVSAVGSKVTRREREVLQLLAEGFPQNQIADRLFISKKTVGTHLANLCRKLDVNSQAQAVAIAYREDILEASAEDYAAAAR